MICSWFRAGVEHCIGQFKKFHILSARYRGQLQHDTGLLLHIVSVIAGTIVLQTRIKPLRTHEPRLDEDDENQIAARAVEVAPAREYVEGKPIGTHRDLLRDANGALVGPGPEPANIHINTGMSARDFSKGIVHCTITLQFTLSAF
jgi:hypothetical protein